MCSNKTDIHRSFVKKYHGYKPVCITLNVKNISIISCKINRIKSLFNGTQFIPIGGPGFFPPVIQWTYCIRVKGSKGNKYRFGNNDHILLLQNWKKYCKKGNNTIEAV